MTRESLSTVYITYTSRRTRVNHTLSVSNIAIESELAIQTELDNVNKELRNLEEKRDQINASHKMTFDYPIEIAKLLGYV